MREFDLIAVLDGTHLQAPIPGLQMIADAGLTAVLSALPRPALRLPQSRARHLMAAAARLTLQEACLPLGTLLPAAQDCSLSLTAASAFLLANRPFLNDLMSRFSGTTQVQITVAWTAAFVLQRFSHEPELAPIFSRGSVSAPDLTEAVKRLALRLGAVMDGGLTDIALTVAPLPLAEDVLWNGALLIRKAALPALDRAVETIDAIWPEGLHIRQIGPAPIASFALLKLEPVSAAQITSALNLLGLRSLADHRDLGATRRRLLMEVPPDPEQREAIYSAARIIEAAARLPDPARRLDLCTVWAEGEATSQNPVREVA